MTIPAHNIHIHAAERQDINILVELGARTFIESHGHSASSQDIDDYVKRTYTQEAAETALKEPHSETYIIEVNGTPVGYSTMKWSVPHPAIVEADVTKLDRLYVLAEFHQLGLGLALFQHAVNLSKNKGQKGMWLYVWVENHKAIRFYQRAGFKVIAQHDFRISSTHTNPNHVMWLAFE